MAADQDRPIQSGVSRKSRASKSILVAGLLLTIVGVSGFASLSLPESGTALLTSETYVRLDGRYFGDVSGSYSSLQDLDIGFCVCDQHDWDIGRADSMLTSYSSHGDPTEFAASLPASQAYYLYFFYVTPLPNQTYYDGYGPPIVELHWHIWGPSAEYSLVFGASVLFGVAAIIYGDHAGQNRIGGAIYSGWKREGV